MTNPQILTAINRDLLSYKAFYFFFMSGFGSLFPYLPVYLRQMGLSASHVGLLIGLRPIVQLASAPFWAILADKYKKRKGILIMSILAWLIMTLALAFVEPTDEICEVRTGNKTFSQFVNYTKIKTGFFRRRSLRRAAEKTETKSVRVSVPLTRAYRMDLRSIDLQIKDQSSTNTRYPSDRHKTKQNSILNNTKIVMSYSKTLRGSAKQIPWDARTSRTSNSQSSEHNFQFSETAFSARQFKQTRKQAHREEKKNKDGKKALRKGLQKSDTSETSVGDQTASHVHSEISYSRIQTNNNTFLPPRKQRMRPRPLTDARVQTKTILGASNLNESKWTGFYSSTIKQRRKNNHSSPLTTRHETRRKSVIIEFSEGDFKDDATSASGAESGDHAVHIWEPESISTAGNAARRLQKQIAKSANLLNSMADNTSKIIIHKTLALFRSHKKEGYPALAQSRQNSSQLSSTFKSLMKSSQALESSGVPVVESSGKTGSSPSFTHNEHDFSRIADIMIKQKNGGLKTLDNLHQKQIQHASEDVIHHNVLSHHVLYDHHEETAVSSKGHAQSHHEFGLSESSGSGMEDNRVTSFMFDKNQTVNNISRTNEHQQPTNDDIELQGIKTAMNQEGKNLTMGEDERLSGQNEIELSISAISSTEILPDGGRMKITLTNLLKTNELEMSRIFTIFLILVVVGEFLESPSVPLADASLLEILGENRGIYGKQRLWGSMGFGLSSCLVGVLLERSKHVVCGEQYTDYMICFCVFAVVMLLTLFVTFSFDFHDSDSQSSSSSVFSAICNVHYGSCLLAACVMGIDFSMCHNFLTWFLEDLGASKSLMGLAIVSRCFADSCTFYFAGSIIKTIGHIRVMIMVLISYTVILLTFSILDNPWWVIPVEVLDGITYAMAWSTCCSYLAGAVPAESVTTLQGILQGIYWGLGTGSGTITGGYLIHHIGAPATFRLTAGGTFLMCLLFASLQWRWTAENGVYTEYPQTKYTYLPTVKSKDTEALLSGYDLPRDGRKGGRGRKAKLKSPY